MGMCLDFDLSFLVGGGELIPQGIGSMDIKQKGQ